MQKYHIKLVSKKEIAEETVLYSFKKPEGFVFKAGQYAVLQILDAKLPDKRNNIRSFSFASAPQDETLEFVMRHSNSGFKQNLETLELGETIQMTAPCGRCIIPEGNTKPIVFLAGGVGITPVRSIMRESIALNRKEKFILFYSSRTPESAAHLDEISNITEIDWTCVNTMTDMENAKTGWSGKTGFITIDMIKEEIKDLKTPLYFIIGTAGFVNSMTEILLKNNVDKNQIHADNFG